jgi:protein ImuB
MSSALFGAVYVPNFILQAVGRSEPELRTQPLVIIDGPPPTYQVIAINRLAELLGVAHGMTKAAAGQFAQVTIRPRCKVSEEVAHAALLDVAWSVTPRVEDTATDTLLIDLSGLTSLFGDEETIARRIAARASSIGLDVHVAVSANVETARIVARALRGPTIVPEGEECRFLETLPVRMLSPSEELSGIFERWGVTTCKSLVSLPLLSLSECVGQEGVRLHAIASGKGMRSLLFAKPAQEFEEWFELDEAVDNLESLSFLLGRLLDQLSARLSARALSIAAIRVNFELQPAFDDAFDTKRDLLRIKPAPTTFSASLELPVPTRDTKLLLKLLRLRLQSNSPGAPIQKIHMSAQSSHARVTQGSLFIPTAPDPDKLELTIARIASVVGRENVGSPQLLDSHRPDAFHTQNFSIAGVVETVSRDTSTKASTPDTKQGAASQIALHVFRPPIPARVKLQANQPVFASFQGCSGKVLHASGPWQTSGDWWENKPWQEAVWDLEIQLSGKPSPTHGFYRLSYDELLEKWFVRGVYD